VTAHAQLTRAVRTVARRDARLRRAVQRLGRCLPALPRSQRRVLLLRAGDRAGRTRSRARVARITGLSRRRVTYLELTGLRRLRTLAGANACQGAAGGETATAGPGAAGTTATPTAGGGATPVADTKTRGDRHGRTGTAPDAGTPSRNRARELSTSPSGPTGADLAVPALLFLGAAAVAIGIQQIRRGNRPAA
jgi:hypothetical protein